MVPKRFALIAHPAGHTMSPFLHGRLFAFRNEAASYGSADIPPSGLAAAVPRLRPLSGFNVSIPYKRAIIPMLDGCDEKAAAIGSVNTVKNENGRLTGYTTDGEGFRRALEFAGQGISGKTAVLGAGGAARAIVFEALRAGGEVTVAARPHSLEAAHALAADAGKKIPGARVSACLISELRGKRDLLVNATPAGMYPQTNGCAANAELVENSACVFDAVYNPCVTEFLSLAKALGKPAVGGTGMLVCQAAASEEIWLGAHFSDSELLELCAETALETRKKFGNIVLCGFMGGGKTTCGRLLAAHMGRKFLDLDEFISAREGMSVAEIFRIKGEPAFRKMEKEAVKGLSHASGLVIAAGGGTLLSPENAGAFRENGIVVWLDASLGAVRSRISNDGTRPLLAKPGALESLYTLRRGRYRGAADFTVNADESPENIVKRIMGLLKPADTPKQED